jgi:LAS superfamily LD-carboxypeptidase LdcB
VALPVRSIRVPPILKKHQNGDLPLELLVRIRPYGWLYKTAAASWTAMKKAAKKDGVVLKPTSAMDAYRPVTVQRSVFFQRYTTTKLEGRPTRNYNQAVWWLKPGYAPLAAPGTSNHGWGLAVDVWAVGDDDRLDWLLGNHARFGWSWEVQSEPWHIRYVLGDDLPEGVTLPDDTDDEEGDT